MKYFLMLVICCCALIYGVFTTATALNTARDAEIGNYVEFKDEVHDYPFRCINGVTWLENISGRDPVYNIDGTLVPCTITRMSHNEFVLLP